MSLWRKEASARLPELQATIASRAIDNPMMLWIELQLRFEELCQQKAPPIDLLKRIWQYAKWCMNQPNEDVATAAALAFCEHLLSRKATSRILPQIMTRHDYEWLKPRLLYHGSEQDYADVLRLFAV